VRDFLLGKRGRIPVILQAERAECALACICMVAVFYGHKVDLNGLRRTYGISASGACLQELLTTAGLLSLHARPLRLELEELSKLKLPAVLHWDMTHFVVLKKTSGDKLFVNDPAVGERCYRLSEADRRFSGVAVEFTPGRDLTPVTLTLRSRLQDLFTREAGFFSSVSQLFVLSLLLQLASVGGAFYMQLVIDEGVSRQDRDMLVVLATGFLMLAMSHVMMNCLRSSVLLYFSNQLGFQMVANVFAHLLRLPVAFFERRHVGDLVSRFGAIREIRRIITEDLVTVVLDGFFALITLAVMFYFSPLLAGVVLLFVTTGSILKLLCIPKIQTLQEQLIVSEAATSSSLMENMRAIEAIKFYCRELPRMLQWRNLYAEQINHGVNLTRFSIRLDLAFGTLFAFENILVIYLAAAQVLEGRITLGFLTAFVALKGNFSASIRLFVDKLVQIRLVRLQLERVSDITCAEREFDSFYLPRIKLPVDGKLTVEGLTYGYPGAPRKTLMDVNLELAAGEILAITGASGSGKSTLIKLMAGLLQPDTGCVRLDGTDIRQFGIRQYRDRCAGVLQTDQLLSGSILDNITMYDDECDQHRLQEAVRMACIDDFIDSLPMSFNSLVGDMGAIMSAGQGQRLLLARAFYKKPALLFLDEATANLDPATEERLLVQLRASGISIVLVTHRAAPLTIADRVLRCESGRLCVHSQAQC
jgi:ATP-binding cassette, subfamily B, bacterial CvaB/MchF/RaxB